MPLSAVPTLGAGATLWYEDPATPDAWVELPNALNIGQAGIQSEAVQVTPIKQRVHEFISGMSTPPDKQFDFNHQPGLAAYAAFLVLVDQGLTIRMRNDYMTGERITYNVALLGRMMEAPEANAQNKLLVFGKQSGAPDWSEIPAS